MKSVKNEVCLKFKKSDPKPVVAYPLAREFNETVALDLHELDSNLYYFHFDHFTTLSGAAIIRSKDPGIVLNKFLQHWVSLYGSPRKVLSGNGGEFNLSRAVGKKVDNVELPCPTVG